jgi:hydroxylamine reductase
MSCNVSDKMFCYQCEQAAHGTACTTAGVCGKDATTSALQDLLTATAQGISHYAHRLRQMDASAAAPAAAPAPAPAPASPPASPALDRFVVEALFATVTNVSFDPERIATTIRHGATLLAAARARCQAACASAGGDCASSDLAPPLAATLGDITPSTPTPDLVTLGAATSIARRLLAHGPDIAGLQELVLYGLKGMAAYAEHARILGVEDEAVYGFIHEALSYLATDPTDVAALTALALRVGEVNLKVMGLLDTAHTNAYGHPEPTTVRVSPVAGKAILVTGHDLRDLEMLLEQTAGTGVNVYTHGEMLPALAYPGLKRHAHLAGNYGGAWQEQRREFGAFPGAILVTTNCIQRPADAYRGRLFTTGLVSWPGVAHIEADASGHKDFGAVIAAARAASGFETDAPLETITVGFARHAVLGVAGAVIDAVKSGRIRHFFLVGGCDGAKPGRNYYTELAEKIPNDCVILTLACGKFRFNRLDLGAIGGIPRLLDVGQCNDAYSAIQIAVALAEAFGVGVNDLPLSLILSWYEQKAVCILLTLLHLGIQNIRLGPSLPAFVGPGVLNVLAETFGLKPITTVDEDLAAILG